MRLIGLFCWSAPSLSEFKSTWWHHRRRCHVSIRAERAEAEKTEFHLPWRLMEALAGTDHEKKERVSMGLIEVDSNKEGFKSHVSFMESCSLWASISGVLSNLLTLLQVSIPPPSYIRWRDNFFIIGTTWEYGFPYLIYIESWFRYERASIGGFKCLQ